MIPAFPYSDLESKPVPNNLFIDHPVEYLEKNHLQLFKTLFESISRIVYVLKCTLLIKV